MAEGLAQGLFCEPGGFFIDPLRPVDRAVITHGHSDHARPGHRAVLATADTLAMMRARLGDGGGARTRHWGGMRPITLGEVRVWLSPAGHVLGSAQVAMEYRGLARGGQRRLQAGCGSDMRGVRAGAVRRVRHRGDVRAAGVRPSAAGATRSRGCWTASRCFPSGRMSWVVMRWEKASG